MISPQFSALNAPNLIAARRIAVGWIAVGWIAPITFTAVLCVVALPQRSAADEPGLADPATLSSPASETPQSSAATSDESTHDDAANEASAIPVHSIGPGKRPPDSLEPLIEFATRAQLRFESEVDAYTCLLVKRETLEGKLEPTHYIRLKIRERRVDGERLVQPRSLYAKFLKPSDVVGREVLYVENERDGDLLVRRGGTRLPNLTVELDPEGRLAKRESHYSIVQSGIRPMLEQILERIESEIDPDNIKIRYFADAKVDGRPCQHIEVSQVERRSNSTFQVAKVYIDIEHELPVFFSSYAWADNPEDDPVLQEQYAITQIDLNAELTDLDFDRTNPQYQFRPEDESEKEADSDLP
ncbi:DUF1571 domain-containing protein [Allorhodopirellula solitaria]|uniref:Uncharacterized protein n=1 Tax=Allorhodopirellula solitaria TaxID=2527987 RepID=A0A5C5X1U1_9BACT|nr:DUF1571 domain-containing protein [Allorhodopirellula solitaria]TWT56202.1 hypothetical protein CA85_43840 [Allorhodopirellula solitaria]